MTPSYHPVYLDLRDRPVLIVGGGAVALEKLNSLLPTSGARITVLAPEVDPQIQSWQQEGRLAWVKKTFEEADVEPFFMIIAATDDAALNAHIFDCGNRRLRLTNSVDDPQHCNFIMAAITRQGPMQVAISSAGASPALAQRVRNRIAKEILTEDVGQLAAYLGEWRPRLKRELPHYRARQGFWERAIDSHIPGVLAEHGPAVADTHMEQAIEWSKQHLSCLGCECNVKGFVCAKEAG